VTIELYLVFVLASILLAVTPGPNVALIVGTSLGHGMRGGLLTVAGVNVGLVLQVAAVAAGLSWLVELFRQHFDLIRYIGAAYLIFLGLQQLLAKRKAENGEVRVLRGNRAFARGLAVAFANPKTLIFYAAFLPQFLPNGDTGAALWLLAGTVACIAAVSDTLYAVFAARARTALSSRVQRIANRVSGVILLGGAGVLLAARR
jgi:threonine/homoserine/homoserine lactone efflux protein